MDHYLEIRLLPDPEFPVNVLMNALFSKLHRGLVAYGGQDVGVSFPEHKHARLGQCLRLHGSTAALNALMACHWLTGMRDHCVTGVIQPVPESSIYRIVRRIQAKSNPERLRRRRITRGATEQQALSAIPDHVVEYLLLPFVTVTSRSTSQQFRLFIDHQPLLSQPIHGCFSAYGLSSSATVPWF